MGGRDSLHPLGRGSLYPLMQNPCTPPRMGVPTPGDRVHSRQRDRDAELSVAGGGWGDPCQDRSAPRGGGAGPVPGRGGGGREIPGDAVSGGEAPPRSSGIKRGETQRAPGDATPR